MGLRLRLRALIFPAILTAALVLAAVTLIFLLRGGEAPRGLVNTGILSRLAARYRVQYSVQSLRLGPILGGCGFAVDAGGVALTLLDLGALDLNIDNIHNCSPEPLAIRGMKAGLPSHPDLAGAEAAEVQLESGKASIRNISLNLSNASPEAKITVAEVDASTITANGTARDIRFSTGSETLASIRQISTGPLLFTKQTGLLKLDSIAAAGVEIRLQNSAASSIASAAAPGICERTRSLISAAGDMAGTAAQSTEAVNQTLFLLRRDLLHFSFILPAAFFLLKIWSLGWRRPGLRMLLGAAPVLVPVCLVGIAGSRATLLQLIVVSLALSAVLALLLRFKVYRHASHWYQRWEPFTVDLACFVIVLPIAAYNFDSGAPFRLPATLEIGRVNLADFSLSGSQAQCGPRQIVEVKTRDASIEQVHLDLPATSAENPRFQIARLDLAGISAGVHDERTPGLDSVTVSDGAASGEAIGVQIDWKSRRIRDLDAHLRLRGVLKAAGAAQELRRSRVFRDLAAQANEIGFSVDLTAAGARSEPPVPENVPENVPEALPTADAPGATVALRGAIALDPERCDLKYAWSARLATKPLSIVSAGLGDSRTINIQTIRTLPGSALRIRDGAGRISIARDISSSLRLLGLQTSVAASRLDIDSAELSAAATSSCSPMHQNVSAGIAGARIERPDGSSARIERTEIQFNRTAAAGTNPASLIATVRNARFTGVSPQITANLPLLRLALDGVTTPESIPRRFEGGLALSLSTGTDVLFRNDTPLKILADLWEGGVTVPDQQQVILQSIVPQLPVAVPLRLSLAGGLPGGGVTAQLQIPLLPMDLGSIRTELRELRLDANTATARLAYESGWSRVSLPKLPTMFCLTDVSQFDLSTEGSIARLLLPERPSALSTLPGNCAEAPEVPTERTFKIGGEWPSLRLDDASGFGIRIRDIAGVQLRKADLLDGRLRSLELESKLSGIQTPDGAGSLGVNAHVTISDATARVTTSLLGMNEVPLVDAALDRQPSQVDVDVTPRTGTEELFSALRPFLAGAGFSIAGITPRARIDRLHGTVQFEGAAPASVNLRMDIGTGPLVSIDFPDNSAALKTLDLSLVEDPASPSGNGFRLDWSKDSIGVHADLKQLSIRARDRRGAEIQATASLHTTLNGTLSESRPPSSPVLAMLSRTADDIGRHFTRAFMVFGNPSGSVSRPLDLGWKLRVHNSQDGESLLRLAGETVRVRLSAAVEKFGWRAGQGALSNAAAAAEFSGDLTIHDGQLVLDAYAPAHLEVGAGAAPARKIDLDLPLLIAFGDRLKPAPDSSAALWDNEYYTRFWNTYRVTQADGRAVPAVDAARLIAGPLSLRQIVIPIEPLRISVGHADRLELKIPFSGRTLFGSAGGSLETALTWREDQASIDSRFNLALRNIQAGAVGLDSEYGHAPLLEDELDGDIMARTDGWRVDRSTFSRMADLPADFPAQSDLEALSLRLKLSKSSRSQGVPGMLQLSSDAQTTTLNAILTRVLRNWQLAGPPQKMSYRNLMLDFRMDRGKVATEIPWLTIDGLQLFSSTNLAVEGNVRLHGDRHGETLELRNLLDAITPR